MNLLTIKEFSLESGVSDTIILKRINSGEIIITPIKKGNRFISMINTDMYPPKKQGKRKAGAPKKHC